MVIVHADTEIKIRPAKMAKLLNDHRASAAAVRLRYVSDTDKGITRVKKGKAFDYLYDGKKVSDADTLERIRRLVIPPAWENVWICRYDNGHIQVTGQDVRGRKQYKYHPLWNALRNETKYYRLLEFGKCLPLVRERLQKDLAKTGLPKEKVLAAIVSIMDKTSIRIGSSFYEKLYGSFGLSTMKDKHVTIDGGTLRFSFKGKKGVYHDISLKSRRLANIVKQCRDIPGKELFQYYNTDGNAQSIDSGEVNDYIREISCGDFTSKDFRTWTGSVQCLLSLSEIGMYRSQAEMKRNLVQAIDVVAQCLGNTRTVCKKHYIHPVVLSTYENTKLERYLEDLKGKAAAGDELTACEEMLLELLEKETV
ncbi:MAG: topoisomerase [Chitinophagaceae bacterium]|nr:topoisomerase [Chitinophagaceae bacterium]